MYAFLSIGLFSVFILVGLNFERKLERQKASRKERRPFNLEVKLLRRPGEGLLTEIEKLGKEITLKIFFICYLGASSAAIIGIATPILPHGLFWQLGVIGTVLLFYAIFGVRSFRGLLLLIEKRDRYYLGYFGECSVAEYLDELKHDGHFVFHDIPAKSTRYNFNIDHVVVGPTGLFAIETKTRSKYWPREAKIREKIEFDGERLIFTGGPDTSHIEQAAIILGTRSKFSQS
jgi:hypothetical protein